jgi:hypothetical protein
MIRLNKPKSRQHVIIETDRNDDWFLYVKFIENKTEEVTHTSMIIRKDLPGWITYLGSMGWKEDKGV